MMRSDTRELISVVVSVVFAWPIVIIVIYTAAWFISWLFLGPILLPLLLYHDTGIPLLYGLLIFNAPICLSMWAMSKNDLEAWIDIDMALMSALAQFAVGALVVACWHGVRFV